MKAAFTRPLSDNAMLYAEGDHAFCCHCRAARNVAEHGTRYLKKNTEGHLYNFYFWSLAWDKTTEMAKPDTLMILVSGITAEFDRREEQVSLQAMHGSSTGEDWFEKSCFG